MLNDDMRCLSSTELDQVSGGFAFGPPPPGIMPPWPGLPVILPPFIEPIGNPYWPPRPCPIFEPPPYPVI